MDNMKIGLRKLRIGKGAQASLELAVSLIVVFILLFGALQVFFWVNNRMVLRQKDYEAQRVDAGNNQTEMQVNESSYPALNIFGN